MPSCLELLTIGVFTAHLLAVNLAMAGPLWLVWLDWRSRSGGDETARVHERSLARWSLAAFGAGVVLGLALLGLVVLAEDRPYLAAVRMIPRDRLWFAGGELLFYAALLAGYLRLIRATRPRRWATRILAVAAASNLLAHFPPLFAMLSALTHRPELWGRTLERGLYHALLVDPEVQSRVLHIWLAALAMGAIVVVAMLSRPTAVAARPQTQAISDVSHRLATTAARWAFVAIIAEFPVGIWTLTAAPTANWGVAWTDDWLAMLLLGSAIIGACLLLQQLAGLALGAIDGKAIRNLFVTLAFSTALMCAVTHYWRRLGRATRVDTNERRILHSDWNGVLPHLTRALYLVAKGFFSKGSGSGARPSRHRDLPEASEILLLSSLLVHPCSLTKNVQCR